MEMWSDTMANTYTYSGSSISQEDWDYALALVDDWQSYAKTEGLASDIGVLARAFAHLKVCYDQRVQLGEESPSPEARAIEVLRTVKQHIRGTSTEHIWTNYPTEPCITLGQLIDSVCEPQPLRPDSTNPPAPRTNAPANSASDESGS
jgi:hypothetical protein